MSAYEEIAKIIRVMDQGNDPEYSKHVGAMKKMALDSNAAAIDVGLDTLNIYIPLADQALRYRPPGFISLREIASLLWVTLERHPHGSQWRFFPLCLSVRDAVVPGLIDKAVAAARGTTRQKSQEALLLFMEVQTPDPVMVGFVFFSPHVHPRSCADSLAFLPSGVVGATYSWIGQKEPEDCCRLCYHHGGGCQVRVHPIPGHPVAAFSNAYCFVQGLWHPDHEPEASAQGHSKDFRAC